MLEFQELTAQGDNELNFLEIDHLAIIASNPQCCAGHALVFKLKLV